jgi:predicted RNase H-like HicB family nuclease
VVTGQKFLHFPVALPLCDTMEEVSANLKDAIKGWLEVASFSHKLGQSDRSFDWLGFPDSK